MLKRALLAVCRAALCSAIAASIAGCEGDALAPSSDFQGSECQKTGQCGDDKIKLDAGGGTTNPTDSGTTSTDPDGGVASPDTGVEPPDSGDTTPPDSGVVNVPPSVFLDLNGTWNTRYEFDLSSYLFGISGIADEIDLVDQALNG